MIPHALVLAVLPPLSDKPRHEYQTQARYTGKGFQEKLRYEAGTAWSRCVGDNDNHRMWVLEAEGSDPPRKYR